MKDRIFTNNVRNIKKAFPRFLALLIMGALGVFAFAGLMAVAPDMIDSLDRYLDDQNVYDIKIVSDMGLDPGDVSAVKELPDIEEAEGVYYRDSPVKLREEERVVNISSLPKDINKIELTSGRLPEAKNEIAVEEALLEVNGLKAGDIIQIDDKEGFYETEVMITGTVRSPLFYNAVRVENDRGITNVGAGILNYYAYVPESNFRADYISVIYATVVGTKDLTTGSDKYLKLIDDANAQIESIRVQRQDSRFKTIIGLADAKIDEESAEARAKLEDAAGQLRDAKLMLDDAVSQIREKEAQLRDAENLLDDGLKTLKEKQAELEAGRVKLEQGKKLLDEKQREADRGEALIAEGEKKLESGAAELTKAKEEAAAGKKELDSGQAKIDEGEKQLEEARKKLEEGKAQLDKGKEILVYIRSEYNRLMESEHLTEDIIASETERLQTDIDAARGIFEKLVKQYKAGEISMESAKAVILDAIKNYTGEPTVLERVVFYKVAETYLEPVIKEGEETYNNGLKEYETAKVQLEEAKGKLEDGKRQYEEGLKKIADGEKQLEEGRKELEKKKRELQAGLVLLRNGYAEYNAGLNTLKKGEELLKEGYRKYEEGLAEFKWGEKALEEGKAEYEAGYAEYTAGLAEYEAGRANFDEEIRKAREGISELGTPTWYINDRTGYQTYADYFDDAESIRNIARVFPIVFFMVAILVSLISMSRMVDMDRVEIGTLKSLGYSREKVITKYAFFSVIATVIGSITGAVLGLIIMPTLIFNIYGMLFDLPKFYLGPNWGTTLIAFFTVLFFVVGAGMLKAVQVMREKPADLLRAKAPKPGKRILFERIGVLWRKLRFSDKITIRNLFRYKKRLFVTVFGILGCTALTLCGFGLKDAIVDIPTAQFEEVFRFDATAYLTGLGDNDADEEKLRTIMEEDEIIGYTESMRIKSDCDGMETNIIAVETQDDIKNIFELTDEKTGESITPEKNKAVISGKLSRLTGLNVGDEIRVTDLDYKEHRYTISGVAKNYFEHYLIIDKATLGQFTDYVPNMIYLNTKDLTQDQQKALTSRLLENPNVLNVTFKEKLINNADNMLKSLDKVVAILIILAAILSFVVLYNLANININERHREIATLKVLGFYDKEVDAYINRENIIVTIIGIALGLVAGFFLTRIVVGTVEIEKACFINRIKPMSFVFAAAISFFFTLIVNNIIHFNLRKINMIDSLKSVE